MKNLKIGNVVQFNESNDLKGSFGLVVSVENADGVTKYSVAIPFSFIKETEEGKHQTGYLTTSVAEFTEDELEFIGEAVLLPTGVCEDCGGAVWKKAPKEKMTETMGWMMKLELEAETE